MGSQEVGHPSLPGGGGIGDRRPLVARSPPTGLQSPAAQTQNPTAEWEGAVK